jgi:hypothetical protein
MAPVELREGQRHLGNGAEEAGDEGTTPHVFIIGIPIVAQQQQGGQSKPIKPKNS